MFADFQGFTKISSNLRPHELVEALDAYFIKFDEITSYHNIEQIKTIGDSYMCAGGLPIRNRSNPIDIILAAFEILRYVEKQNVHKRLTSEDTWNLRIGIHSGELIAGVIGTRRFAYDIWGDTVNIASALEHHGEAGEVNISGNTYYLVKDFFDCTFRGKIKTKSPDEVEMYFAHRIKPELSENGEGIIPNAAFREKLQSNLDRKFNYKKAEQHIVKLLKIKLPEGLHYHGLHHTFDVCDAAQRIAKAEGVSGEDLFLLLTAALIHDAGFTVTYMNHEDKSVELAKQILPQYGYSDQQLKVIEGIIHATKLPMEAQTLLEKIMCDADLDYLGRADFYQISEALKLEFIAQGIVKNDKEFDAVQIKFLNAHKYFTDTAKASRDAAKQKRLEEIMERYATYA
jgi:class 3 adenylate cyclase/HD superfamily phosphodiesterase